MIRKCMLCIQNVNKQEWMSMWNIQTADCKWQFVQNLQSINHNAGPICSAKSCSHIPPTYLLLRCWLQLTTFSNLFEWVPGAFVTDCRCTQIGATSSHVTLSTILKVRNCWENWVVKSYIVSPDYVHIKYLHCWQLLTATGLPQLNFTGKPDSMPEMITINVNILYVVTGSQAMVHWKLQNVPGMLMAYENQASNYCTLMRTSCSDLSNDPSKLNNSEKILKDLFKVCMIVTKK